MTTQEILSEVISSYKLGLSYFECDYNEMKVKFRFNKDHARNGGRNDDSDCHNLSLINVYGNGASQVDSYYENETIDFVYIQKQVWGVMDLEDVEKEVITFLEEIDYSN